MKEEPFKYHKELKGVYLGIPDRIPDAFFSGRVMAEVMVRETDAAGLFRLVETFLAPAFITLGASMVSCVYLVLHTWNLLDSMELFSAMGLLNGGFLNGDFGL